MNRLTRQLAKLGDTVTLLAPHERSRGHCLSIEIFVSVQGDSRELIHEEISFCGWSGEKSHL